MYSYLMNKYAGDEAQAQSYAFRMLIHNIGDLEQPLHSIARFSKEYPKGDAGGNAFKLPYRYRVTSLHALWDKVLYQERNNIRRPISDDDWEMMQAKVQTIFDDHSDAVADATVYNDIDIDRWSEENFELAISLYDGIKED